MPLPSGPLGAFRSLRNARLSGVIQAQAAALGDSVDEALSHLVHHLSSGAAHPLIQPSPDITPEISAEVSRVLSSSLRHTLLAKLSSETEDSDFLSLWESVEQVAHALALHSPMSTLREEAKVVSARISAEMQSIPGAEGLGSAQEFSAELETFIESWAEEAPKHTEGEARLLFLSKLVRHALARCAAPASTWEMFLLKLELAAASPSRAPQLARLLSPVFRVAWAALPLMPALHAFWKLHGSAAGIDLAACERITALAIINHAGSRHATRLREGMTPDWMLPASGSELFATHARWRSALASSLELAAYQPILNASDACARLIEGANGLAHAIGTQASSLRKIADDLAQGMPGRETPEQLTKLAADLLEQALWTSCLTANPAEARGLFLPRVVRELGLDPSSAIWKKHTRLVSSLQQIATANGSDPLPWADAAGLLRSVDSRALEIKQLPLRWSVTVPRYAFEGVAFNEADGPDRCARDTSLLLSRIAIDHRIHGSLNGDREALRWYAEEVLPHLQHVPDEGFRERWDLLCETGFSPDPEHAHLNRLARRFGLGLPVLTAAWKLDVHAESIAEAVADEVLTALPDYAKKIGQTGRISCVRDNALTLRQVASLLLSEAENPAEILAEWWNSAVGSYLATRPIRLFETNLNALFHALGSRLDAVELKAAFEPIQQVYRESLGIECLEALAGPATQLAGPLLRKISQSAKPPEPDREVLRAAITKSLSARGAAQCADALVSVFLTFHQERWNGSGADSATARCLGALSAEPLFGNEQTCASSLFEALAGPHSSPALALLMQESAHDFMFALGQASMARALAADAAAIADAYASAVVSFAPAHFEKLGGAESIQRCRRDQTLLLKKLAARLAHTAPTLFWIDATRWYLELLAPFIDYPAAIWALSSRTVAKHLGPRLTAPGRAFLARWTSHFEHLARGWASCHQLARHAFRPTDYSFSARPDEDRIQRDLLAACIASAYAPPHGPWSSDALLTRFLLSWPGSLRSEAEANRTLASITQAGGARIPRPARALLDSVPKRLSMLVGAPSNHTLGKLASATGISAHQESVRTLELIISGAPEEWNRLLSGSASKLAAPLAQAALRAHLLHCGEPDHRRALASEFPAAARERAGCVAACLGLELRGPEWTALSADLESVSKDSNTLRSHLTTLALEWPAVQAALAVSQKADDHARALLDRLGSNADVPYNEAKDRPCDGTTNQLAFGYVFRQAASSVWDACAEAPRLFFGQAAENHRMLPASVAANAHTRVFRALSEQLPLTSTLAGTALLSMEAAPFQATPPLWRDLASGGNSPAHVAELFAAIRPLADAAAAYACPSDSAARQALALKLRYPIEAVVCGLHESGDIEAAWELMLHRLSPDLDTMEPDRLVSAFYGLTRDPGGLSQGSAAFMRGVLTHTVDVVRQALLGRCLLVNARQMAEDYAASVFAQPGDAREKCMRDQLHLLTVLGHLLSTQAPLRAWLNFTTSMVELTLPHIKEGAGDLAALWTKHEAALARKLPTSVQPALWSWSGALQKLSRNLPAVRPLAASVVPVIAPRLAAAHGGDPEDWRRLLCGLAASAASSDDGPAPGGATLEKLFLATPLQRSRTLSEWTAITDQIGSEVEALLPGRVPNSLRRRLNALSELSVRCAALVPIRGSRLVRMCCVQAAHPTSKTLWSTSLLARSRVVERMVESDPCDTAASRALGVPLEPDETVLAKLDLLRTSAGLPTRLTLQPKKQAGLLSMIGLGKRGFDWANSTGLKAEACYVVDELALRSVAGAADASHAWFWSCPGVISAMDPEKEEGSIEFYAALASAVREALGPNHPVVPTLEAFAASLRARILGTRLAASSGTVPNIVALHLLGVRMPSDASSYAKLEGIEVSHLAQLLPKSSKETGVHNEKLLRDSIDTLRRAAA